MENVDNDADGNIPDFNITGIHFQYYLICHRKLWLFSHNIRFESEHENVHVGRFLHKDRYKREKKEITIPGAMAVDFIKTTDGLELCEIKKSKRLEPAHKLQMMFYLTYLKERGVSAKGTIVYPLMNRREPVTLDENGIVEVNNAKTEIRKIICDRLPLPERKGRCKKCAYEDFCFGDEA
jgi:CRISPR-associated exonuclease Cas4